MYPTDSTNQSTSSNSLSAYIKKSKHSYQSSITNGDHEEELRELILLQLQSYCGDSMDELNSIQQEMKLLEHMEDLRELEDVMNPTPTLTSSSSSSSSSNNNRQAKNIIPGLPSNPYLRDGPGGGDATSEGISITKTHKVGDQLVMT